MKLKASIFSAKGKVKIISGKWIKVCKNVKRVKVCKDVIGVSLEMKRYAEGGHLHRALLTTPEVQLKCDDH